MALRVLICATCAQPGAEPQGISLVEALRDRLPPEIGVETCACMVQCGSPVAVALRGEDRYAYVFAGVDPAADVNDLCALVRLYADAPGGEITDARPAGALRHKLVARLPR